MTLSFRYTISVKERKVNQMETITTESKRFISNNFKKIYKYRELYLIVLPVLLFYALFAYKPIYGVIIAFKNYNYRLGIMGSEWAGLKHFYDMFDDVKFWSAFYNTLIIAAGRIFIEFPIPIGLALIINEIRNSKAKKFFQTIYTFPHFLSWVIISGIALNFLGDSGTVNGLLQMVGLDKVNVLTTPSLFRGFIFGSNIWKEMGWGTIIYLAAIAGIDPTLYEAAEVDGANRWHRMTKITLPSLMPTIVILLTLNIGRIMSLGGFDQILNTYNPAVYDVADILDTFVYRRTFSIGESFSSSAAIGLFKSVINFILLFSANKMAGRIGHRGLF